MADNVITATGYDDGSTSNTSDDRMGGYSYLHSTGEKIGCFKPDLAGPATIGDVIGTSISAPVVAGVITLMLELRPSLAAYPQAVKAILLASCQRKALKYVGDTDAQETMDQGLTNKQGAGVVDAYLAICITGQGHYGVREITGGIVSQTIRLRQPSYGATGMNISIAWLRENTASGSSHLLDTDVTAGTRHNLNLQVSYGSTQKSSSTAVSSTEMVYLSPLSSDTDDYTITVQKASEETATVRYGYAWCLDNERFQGAFEYEGIYFLKNKSSGQYLLLDSNWCAQHPFYDTETQQWVIRKSGSSYLVHTASSTQPGVLSRGSAIPSSYEYYSIVSSASNTLVSLVVNEDGSASFLLGTNALGILNNSASTGTPVSWSTYSSTNESQKWYLEPLAYRKGDVNMDGSIDSEDARLVNQYAVDAVTFSAPQQFLADVNNDGVIDSKDSRLINQITVA